jgi:hypothetical protein
MSKAATDSSACIEGGFGEPEQLSLKVANGLKAGRTLAWARAE